MLYASVHVSSVGKKGGFGNAAFLGTFVASPSHSSHSGTAAMQPTSSRQFDLLSASVIGLKRAAIALPLAWTGAWFAYYGGSTIEPS